MIRSLAIQIMMSMVFASELSSILYKSLKYCMNCELQVTCTMILAQWGCYRSIVFLVSMQSWVSMNCDLLVNCMIPAQRCFDAIVVLVSMHSWCCCVVESMIKAITATFCVF